MNQGVSKNVPRLKCADGDCVGRACFFDRCALVAYCGCSMKLIANFNKLRLQWRSCETHLETPGKSGRVGRPVLSPRSHDLTSHMTRYRH